jgi:diphthamide biosynthesis enzyme Dph1/Dph2-like protein
MESEEEFVARVGEFVAEGGYERVALELAGAQLGRAPALLAALSRRCPSARFAVQGERWHAACCPELLGDARFRADALVHVGEWCGALPPLHLALLVVPGAQPLPSLEHHHHHHHDDHDHDETPGRLLYHLSLSHALPALRELARARALRLEEVALRHHARRHCALPQHLFAARCQRERVLYVTPLHEDPRALLLALSLGDRLTVIGPSSSSSSAAASLFFGRRLRAVRQCRAARATGLLAVAARPGAAAELARLAAEARAAGRVPYTLYVGKTSPVKLLNFAGLSAFVLVGCPLATLLLAETLASPVCALLTPLEHRLACLPERAWQPLFLFGEPQPLQDDDDDNDDDEEEDAFSRQQQQQQGALVLTSGDAARQIARVSPAAALLRQPGRWVGVDAAAPSAAAAPPLQGRSGIASAYEDEPK